MKKIVLLLLVFLLFGCDDSVNKDKIFDCNTCNEWEICNTEKTSCVPSDGKCNSDLDCLNNSEGNLLCKGDDNHTCVYDGINPCIDKTCTNGECSVVNNTAVCICNNNFHDENDVCVANKKLVECDKTNIPENATEILGEVEIIWSNGAWSTPLTCTWNCNNDFHKEGETCVSNTKTEVCINVAPENATSVEENITQVWSDGMWSELTDCDWTCNRGFHREDSICIADPLVKSGDLIFTEIMANPAIVNDSIGEWLEIYNTTNEEIDLSTLKVKKNTSSYTLSSGSMIIGPKSYFVISKSADAQVPSDAISANLSLTNTESTLLLEVQGILMDTITYPDANDGISWQHDENGQWCNSQWNISETNNDKGTPSNFENCSITDPCLDVTCEANSHCNQGSCECDSEYHNEGDGCISNTKTVSCNSVAPENATSSFTNVNIVWIDGEWSAPSNCSWSCNNNYHNENNLCVKNTKSVECLDVAPNNASSLIELVIIAWVNGVWTTPSNCNWNCNENYSLENGVCILDSSVKHGDIIFTEVMPDSGIVSDALGEWLEIYNTTNSNINIENLVIKRGTNTYRISSGETVINANSYFVIARSSDSLVPYNAIGNISLTNNITSLSLELDGVLLDELSYPEAKPGKSWQRDETNQWCDSTWVISATNTDMGTPGTSKSCGISDPCLGISCGDNQHCDGGLCICDADFHSENSVCISDSKMVFCNDIAPENAISNIIKVEVLWNGTTWTTPINCSWQCENGYLLENNECILNSTINYGDLIFTEVMANPEIVSDLKGEWIEIYNTTNRDIDISELVIKRGTNNYKITSGDTVINSNSYFVIARSDESLVSYNAIANISLTNSATTLSLELNYVLLDELSYPDAASGKSWQRDENNQWCESSWAISNINNDLGTPQTAIDCNITDPCSNITCGSNEYCAAGICVCENGYILNSQNNQCELFVCSENSQRCNSNNVEICLNNTWTVKESCLNGAICNTSMFICENPGSTCVGISIDGTIQVLPDNKHQYAANLVSGGVIQIDYYNETPVGTYDLGSVGVNDNYQTCNQCVRALEDSKLYFQESGTLTVLETNGYTSGESKGVIASLKLIEVDIDANTFISTPIQDGNCLELETGSWDTMPATCAELNCEEYDNVHCETVDGASGCYCDQGYIVNEAGNACIIDPNSVCTGISIDNFMVNDTNSNLYQGSIGDYNVNIEFYEEHSLTTYDLASSINNNYQTCNQCVRVMNADKMYFQESGAMTITASNGLASGESAGSITSVKLIEVTIDSSTYVSTPVSNGGCIEIETSSWNFMPIACNNDSDCDNNYICNLSSNLCEPKPLTCEEINCSQYTNTHCESIDGINQCVCDDNYIDIGSGNCVEKPINKKWTIMVYLDADNNLESAGIEDFNEMEKGLYDAISNGNSNILDNLNVIVLMDRTSGYSGSPTEINGSDWTDTRLYKVLPDNNYTYFNSERLDDGQAGIGHVMPIGEFNMGDPRSLEAFVTHVKEYFPADNYSLIFWNHGAGARSTESSPVLTKGVCSDDDNGDILYMNEVQESLSNNFNQNDKLTVIGFDACLMATVEVAYEFRDLAKFMVGSMHTEQGDGWDYEYIFGNLNGSNDESILTGENLVKLVVESYEQFIENYGYNSGETQSAIDLSKLNNLKSSIDQLANAMYLENKKSTIENIRNNSVYYDDGYMADYPYFDLYDFVYKVSTSSLLSTTLKNSANNVISNMREAILKTYGESGNGQSYYYAEDSNAARGLSIFFSRNSSDYYTQKDWYTSKDAFNTSDLGDGYLDFPTTTEDGIVNTWKELMNAWY